MVVNTHARFGLPTMGTLRDTACDAAAGIRRDTSPNEYIAASGFRRCRKNDKDDVIADVIPIAIGNAQGS